MTVKVNRCLFPALRISALSAILAVFTGCCPEALQNLLDAEVPCGCDETLALEDDQSEPDLAVCADPGSLDDCTLAPPCGRDSWVCDVYEDDASEFFFGVSAQCVCQCMPDNELNNRLRTCLACMEEHGVPTGESHLRCYEAMGAGWGTAIEVLLRCGHCAWICP